MNLEDLHNRISALEKRNQKVELEKAWEISWMRRVTLSILTYVVVLLLMIIFELPHPYLSSHFPAVALLLSGPTLHFLKFVWIKYQQ